MVQPPLLPFSHSKIKPSDFVPWRLVAPSPTTQWCSPSLRRDWKRYSSAVIFNQPMPNTILVMKTAVVSWWKTWPHRSSHLGQAGYDMSQGEFRGNFGALKQTKKRGKATQLWFSVSESVKALQWFGALPSLACVHHLPKPLILTTS